MTNFFGNALVIGSGADNLQIQSNQPGTTPWDLNLHMYHLVRTGAYCHECHYNVHSNAQARNTIFGDGTDCVLGVNCAGNAGLPPDAEDGITDNISDTHLINFSIGGPTAHKGHNPVTVSGSIPCVTESFSGSSTVNDAAVCLDWYQQSVEGVTAPNPVWYYDSDSSPGTNNGYHAFRCNLRCHGVVMATCFYRPEYVESVIDGGAAENVSPGEFWCAGGQAQRASTDPGAL
jgi:hypothetical protein